MIPLSDYQVESSFNFFMWIENHLSLSLAIDIYGEDMGQHLWNKFAKVYDREVLVFYGGLDGGNKHILVSWYRSAITK